nr:MAG TPA: hypothetical protein [Caudoviricetes sp.]
MIFICYYYYRHNYFLLGVVRGGLDSSPSAVLQSSQSQQRCGISQMVDKLSMLCYNVSSGRATELALPKGENYVKKKVQN